MVSGGDAPRIRLEVVSLVIALTGVLGAPQTDRNGLRMLDDPLLVS